MVFDQCGILNEPRDAGDVAERARFLGISHEAAAMDLAREWTANREFLESEQAEADRIAFGFERRGRPDPSDPSRVLFDIGADGSRYAV